MLNEFANIVILSLFYMLYKERTIYNIITMLMVAMKHHKGTYGHRAKRTTKEKIFEQANFMIPFNLIFRRPTNLYYAVQKEAFVVSNHFWRYIII
jgi:hypothetical protein